MINNIFKILSIGCGILCFIWLWLLTIIGGHFLIKTHLWNQCLLNYLIAVGSTIAYTYIVFKYVLIIKFKFKNE